MKIEIDKAELKLAIAVYKNIEKVAEHYNVNKKIINDLCNEYNLALTIGSQGARKHYCNHSYFECIDSEEKAYWLGFLMADGCVYAGSDKNSYRLQINLATRDRNQLEKFLKCIESDYSITDKIYKTSEVSQLKINSTQMCKDLINLGVCPRKSLKCTFPNISPELYNHFIRGYFDGDGCITQKLKVKHTFSIVGGLEMLSSFKEIFQCQCFIYSINHSKAFSLEVSSKESIKWLYNYLYSNSTIYMERKKEKFENLMSLFAGMRLKEQSELRGKADDLNTSKIDE